MTAITVTFNGTRIHDMNTTTGLTLGTIGGGAAAAPENTWFWQAVAFIARKITATGVLAGFTATMAATTDVSTATGPYKTLIMKYAVSTASDLQSLATPGLQLQKGNDVSNYNYYDIEGGDTYLQDKLFKFIAIDPNIAGYRSGVVGTPAWNVLDYYAIAAQFVNGGAKDLNMGLDAIDATDGLSIEGGTTPDAAGDFEALAAWDNDTDTRRYSVVLRSNAGVDILGKIVIGSANETRFVSNGEIVVFPDNLAAAGWCGIDVDLTHNNSYIDFSGDTLIGKGNETTTDSRPVLTVTGAGTSALNDGIGANIINWGGVNITDKCDYTNATISVSGAVDAGNGAILVGASILISTVAVAAPALIWDTNLDPNFKLEDMTFSKGANDHHAIGLGSNTPASISLSGQKYSGFNASTGSNLVANSGPNDAAIFNDSGKEITINVLAGGDTPSVRNGVGATTIVIAGQKTLTIVGFIAGSSEIRVRDGSVTLSGGYEDDAATPFTMNFSPYAVANAVKLQITTPGYEYINKDITLFDTDVGIDVTTEMIPDPSWVP